MTTKNSKKGQFAPKSKHSAMAELKKSAHLIGAVLGITAWFVTIWMAAVGIGYLVHWTDVQCAWVPDSMITVGHVIEYLIFGADCVSLVWSVGVHLYHHFKGESDEHKDHE